MGIEFELKYEASAQQQEQLAQLFPGEWATVSMETTYYDTPSHALSARKMTLRRRMENGRAVCALKTPGEDLNRGEWECDCEDITAAIDVLCKLGAPQALKAWAAEGLAPLCGAKFSRTLTLIREADFTAELALDSGVLTGGGRIQPFREVELELKAGSKDSLVFFGQLLAAKIGLQTQPRSKFRRALDLLDE